MENEQRRIRLGRIISFVGAAWIGLFFLARSGLFGSNPFTTVILGMGAFFPIAMMFIGRVVRRRATRTPVETVEQPRPSARPSTQRPRRPDPVVIEEVLPPHIEPVSPAIEPVIESVDIETQAMTSEEMVAEAKDSAELRLKRSLVIDTLVATEETSVSDEDIAAEIAVPPQDPNAP